MSSTVVRSPDFSLRAAFRLALLFAAIKLVLQFALTLWTQHIGYSYFRDEFYYIACGHHLAWGFVDHGPIVALQARLGELLFGDSLFAIRILSALAGAATVFLTGLLAWALGGLRPAQALAMIGVLVAPIYIAMDGFLSMNSFEPVFWMLCALALIRLIDGAPQPFWWTIFGLSAGIGLLNKPSMLFFLIAAGVGLLLTPQRRILFTRWAALGIALIIVIALPYVLWQIHNHWPTLEFFHNGKIGNKNVILGPMGFFLAQLGQMHPANALLWFTGLISLLRARSIHRGRWIGLTFLIFYVLMFVLHAKDYYLAPIYPVLFAAGAIAWERRFATRPL
ncbi:MAG TPA: glycosyltransferase family 39 protein, partial [Silvibacterium sp.]|nr:glycosyltransferase family 39 protein [Silvibacterium sp.]